MAQYTHPSTTYPALPWSDIDIGGGGMVVSETPTLMALAGSDGTETRLTGVGFTYDAFGNPTGGTVMQITRTSAGGGEVYEMLTGNGGGSLGVGLTTIIGAPHDAIFNLLYQGNDTLTGNTGTDYLYGGPGADAMNGDGGTDFADYSMATAFVLADLSTTAFNVGDAIGDSYTSIEGLRGSDFNDRLNGNASANILMGGLGDDSLEGKAGADVLDGGDGTDSAEYRLAADAVVANLGDASLNTGDAAGDAYISIEGLIGSGFDDLLSGSAGNNNITGAEGNDTIFGGAGHDNLFGSNGNDALVGNADIFATELDSLIGDAGNDSFYAEHADSISGGTGTDALYAVNDYDWSIDLTATNIEWMQAGFGNDTITAAGQAAGVTIYASGGNDVLTGSDQGDVLWAGVGNDIVTGSGGDDVIVGDLGIDILSGGDGNDRVYTDGIDSLLGGGNGTDALYITGGSGLSLNLNANLFEWVTDFVGGTDAINGAAMTVAIEAYAGAGNDIVSGGTGGDFLWGEGGNDTLTGGVGDDALVGGIGSDQLSGGTGIDNIFCSSGSGGDGSVDTVIFSAAGFGTDFVFDFEHGIDKLNMQGSGANAGNITITSVDGHAQVHYGADLIVVAGLGGTLTLSDFVF